MNKAIVASDLKVQKYRLSVQWQLTQSKVIRHQVTQHSKLLYLANEWLESTVFNETSLIILFKLAHFIKRKCRQRSFYLIKLLHLKLAHLRNVISAIDLSLGSKNLQRRNNTPFWQRHDYFSHFKSGHKSNLSWSVKFGKIEQPKWQWRVKHRNFGVRETDFFE